MVRNAQGDLYEDLVAHQNPEDVPNCCALAVAAGDVAMWIVCDGDGVDYRIEETVNFTTFTECTKTSAMYRNDDDEVMFLKSEHVD